MQRRFLSLLLVFVALALTACQNDDAGPVVRDPGSPKASATVPAVSATPAPSVTATRTSTANTTSTPRPSVTATPTVAATPAATPGRVDGTVAPQGFGGTEPVTVKANPDPFQGITLLTDVRLGVHPEEGGWERIVFQFDDELPPGEIRYVSSVAACGSGQPVTVRGSAVLLARFDQAAAHTEAGQVSVPRTTLTGPGNTLLEARQTCDFEGQVVWAIGVKAQQRFKVTLLANPRRVVIDVKQ